MILDVGCGFDPQGDVNVDLSKTTECNVVADAHFLPFKNGVFSYAVCSEVLEHTASPLKVLTELRRVSLNILVTVPNIKYWTRILRWFLNKPVIASREHICSWDLFELKQLFERAGWRVVKTGFCNRHRVGRRIDRLVPRRFRFFSVVVKAV